MWSVLAHDEKQKLYLEETRANTIRVSVQKSVNAVQIWNEKDRAKDLWNRWVLNIGGGYQGLGG